MREGRDVAVHLHLRIVGQVVDGVDEGGDEVTALGEAAEPLRAGATCEDLVEEGDAVTAVEHALLGAGEARVGRRLGNLEHAAEVLPVAVGLEHGEGDPLVIGAAVVVPERVGGVLPRLARDRAPEHGAGRQAEPLEP